MNRVELTGNISRDAVLKLTPTGKQVVEFGLAVGDGFGEKARTYFFDCVKWCNSQKQADFFGAITKGTKIAVAGKLTWRSWTKDGQKHSKVEVEVQDVDLLGTPVKDPREYAPGQQMPIEAAPTHPVYSTPTQAAAEVYDEDIPF